MSDERDLTPEQAARVTRLLADARADQPIPAEVAARLDRVLEGMSGEQVAGPDQPAAPVVDIAARRRRRAATLLVAAAAVVVAGVGIGQVVGPQGGDDDSAADAGSNGALEAATEDEAMPGPGDAGSTMSDEQERALGKPARIRSDSFAADVRRFQDRPGLRSYLADGVTMDLNRPEIGFDCGPAAYGEGKLVAVRYNGRPAVLAYRPPAGATQAVELLQCGSAEVVRSTTIPLP